MRIKVMVVGLAGVLASWQAQADDTAATASAAVADGSVAVEQVVISGDKLKRTEIDSSASVGSRNSRQISESGNTTLEDVAAQSPWSSMAYRKTASARTSVRSAYGMPTAWKCCVGRNRPTRAATRWPA